MSTPVKMRLDNASNIYPACLSKTYASMFRLSVTLNESIDPSVLQKALENTLKRIPSFGYTLRESAFWWYLMKIDAKPQISQPSGLTRFDFSQNNGFMFKLAADGCSIILDVFHVLGDGGAGIRFILTLTAEYLRLKHGISIEYGDYILDTSQEAAPGEFCDAFRGFSGLKGALEKNSPAYHMHGTVEPFNILHNLRVSFSAEDVRKVARNFSCNITDIIAACMICALQKIHAEDTDPRKRNMLKINIPVDLRRIFGGKTLRNYSSYIFVGIDVSNGYMKFEDILKTVSAQKKLYTMKKSLEPKIAKNVALEDSLLVKCMPRIIKDPVIDIINRMKGDRYCSHTFSNLGNIDLPETMASYVKDMDFALGRQRGELGASAGIGIGGKVVINFTRGIAEEKFEELFCEQLWALGIRTDITAREY